jgi:hypothetical protein
MKAPFPCIAAAFVLMGAAGVAEPAEAPANGNPCELKMYASVDLPPTGTPLVPVSINGKPGAMILNTGSALSSLFTNQAEKLGLQKRRLKTDSKVHFGGALADSYVEVESFGIGGTNFGRKGILIDPRNVRDDERPVPIVGTIDMDMFARMDVELDLARNKLNLFSQDHCKDMGAYWARVFAEAPLHRGQLGELYFAVELEGRRIEATVAADQPATTLDIQVARTWLDFDESSPDIVREGGGERPLMHYKAMKLTAPGLEVSNTKVYLVDYAGENCGRQKFGRKSGAVGFIGCHGLYPLQLGRNILKELRLYFAIRENKVYYTAAGAGRSALPGPVNTQGDAPHHERQQGDGQRTD